MWQLLWPLVPRGYRLAPPFEPRSWFLMMHQYVQHMDPGPLLQVLRLVLFKEVWMGEIDRHAAPPLHKVDLGSARRAQPADLSGSFHNLTLTAAVDAGQSEDEAVKACFSREVEQGWASPSTESSDAGVTWWLPHGMCDPVQPCRPHAGPVESAVKLARESTYIRSHTSCICGSSHALWPAGQCFFTASRVTTFLHGWMDFMTVTFWWLCPEQQ